MNRRFILSLLAAAITSAVTPTRAERSGKVPVVGLLMLSAGPNDPIVERIRRELRGLGYVDGTTIRIEYRGSAGSARTLAPIMAGAHT